MSFGWSAGDLATAVTLIYNLIQALDSCDGAASDYREAVSFRFETYSRPLQAFTSWNAFPSYAKEIEEQANQIRVPVETFLEAVVKVEPSLGQSAAPGHHRHVFRKLQWQVMVSKKVVVLRKNIESHMRIIDTLLQRLTLSVTSLRTTRLLG
jgi:hypothetical protein